MLSHRRHRTTCPGDLGGHRERGSVAVFTAVFALGVIILLALLVDGGSMLNARERAADIAEQAARAAATDLLTADLRNTGSVTIDWATACAYAQQAVTAYAAGFNNVTTARMTSCQAGGNLRTAIVTVEVTTQPAIPAPGFGTVIVTATQQATAACGNADQQEAC
jgi:Flp pilus assembly protein TadG